VDMTKDSWNTNVNVGHIKAGIEDGCMLFQAINDIWCRETPHQSVEGVAVEDLIVRLEIFRCDITAFALWDRRRKHKIYEGSMQTHASVIPTKRSMC
jgi:hypothetical protein